MLSWRPRIGTRLTLSFTVILAFMTFSTGLSIWRLYSVDRMAGILVNEKLSRQQAMADWQNAVDLNATRAAAIAKSDSLELGEYFAALLSLGDARIDRLATALQEGAVSSAEEAALLGRIEQARKAYHAVRGEVFRLKAVGKTIEVEKLVSTQLDSTLARYQAALRELAEHQKAQAEAIARDASAVFRHGVMILVAVGAVAVMIGGFLALHLSRSIVQPVQAAASIAMRVAAGDLTSVVDNRRRDEIGDLMRALQAMNGSLARMALEIQEGVTEIDGALATIDHDNRNLSQRTVLQANALRDIVASMEAITATVKANALHTQQASALSASAADVAARGGDAVAEAVRTMAAINESSKKIVDIIGMIDGIAFQTNILALNAAVEAARAGEQGRGFAVVASEVRSLAQRSASAAREIKELITVSVTDIAAGAKLVDDAGDGMRQVVASIGQVSGIMARIKTASEQQAQDLVSVGQSIDAIDKTTDQNTELVQHAVRAIGGLRSQSMRVAGSVSQFRFDAVEVAKPLRLIGPATAGIGFDMDAAQLCRSA